MRVPLKVRCVLTRLWIGLVAVGGCVALSHFAEAQGNFTLSSVKLIGGPGDQRATAVAIANGKLFFSGMITAGGNDGWAVAYDLPIMNSSVPAWAAFWPNLPGSDEFNAVATSADAVYFVGDSDQRTADPVGGKENKGATVKYAFTGAKLWERQTPPTSAFYFSGFETIWAAVTTTEGNNKYVYVTGTGQASAANGTRLFVCKLKDDGTFVWKRDDSSTMIQNASSRGLAITKLNGYIYVAGSITINPDPANPDVGASKGYLRKYDSAGNLIWSRTRPDPPNVPSPGPTNLYIGVTTFDGSIFAVGGFGTSSNGADFLLDKWSEDGIQQPESSHFDRKSGDDVLVAAVKRGNRLYAVGYTGGCNAGGADAVLLEIDLNAPLGTASNPKYSLFGGRYDDVANGIATDGTDQSDLYVVGETRSFPIPPNGDQLNDAFVLRYVPGAAPVPSPTPFPLPTFKAADCRIITCPFAISNNAISQAVQTTIPTSCPMPAPSPFAGGRAEFNFTVPAAGTYYVQGKVGFLSDDANSFYINIDAEPDACMQFTSNVFTAPGSREYRPVTGPSPSSGPRPFLITTTGTHKLILVGREANAEVEEWTISTATPPPNAARELAPTPAPTSTPSQTPTPTPRVGGTTTSAPTPSTTNTPAASPVPTPAGAAIISTPSPTPTTARLNSTPAPPDESYFFNTLAGPAGDRSIAGFYFPQGLAVDSAQNVYVADTGNNTIRKISTDGTVTTLAGCAPGTCADSAGSRDGQGTTARFHFPQDVAIDDMGTLYVADTYNHTIRKITPDGVVCTLAGLAGQPGSRDDTGSAARFKYPRGVAVDSLHNVYVADTGNHIIRKITSTATCAGVVRLFAGAAGSPGSGNNANPTLTRFNSPQGLTVDATFNVYVADTGNNLIRRIRSTGVVETLAGVVGAGAYVDGPPLTARFSAPKGITVDSTGNVYVGDAANAVFRKIPVTGNVSTPAGLPNNIGSADATGSAARFNGLQGIAIDSAGNAYVADAGNHAIRRIDVNRVVTTIAGHPPTQGHEDRPVGRFRSPYSIAMDNNTPPNAYVVDKDDHVIRKVTSNGAVTTFAGLAGSSGSEDGAGVHARFNGPQGIAFDGFNFYVADTNNHTIRQITQSGAVTTLAGCPPSVCHTVNDNSNGSADGTGNVARFYYPRGVASDGSNVYVADTLNNTIRKIVISTKAVSTLAGLAGVSGNADDANGATDGVLSARFSSPQGIAFAGGNLYVADTSNQTIRKINPTTRVVTTYVGTAASFKYPAGLAADSSGKLYVADTYNHTIRKIDSNAAVTNLAGLAGHYGSADGTGGDARFYFPRGVALDSAGTVYIADTTNRSLRTINGNEVHTLSGVGSSGSLNDPDPAKARFNDPYGAAVVSSQIPNTDPPRYDNTVYIADTDNDVIRKVDPNGVVSTFAGSGEYGFVDNVPSGTARFSNPKGIAVDGTGNVYVADTFSQTIRKITPNGFVARIAGQPNVIGIDNGGIASSKFFDPHGIAVDSSGANVYVADTDNHTIRKIDTATNTVSPFAGIPNTFGHMDGNVAVATFNYPQGVAVDNAGNVYVADGLNNTIRLISNGTVTTIAGSADFPPGNLDANGASARFNFPVGIAAIEQRLGHSEIYVADGGNGSIRLIRHSPVDPDHFVITLAGLGGNYGSADGVGSGARFFVPEGIAVASDGRLYVADNFNNVIRKGEPPPFIESPPTAIGTVGIPFIYQIIAPGANTFAVEGLPHDGLQVDSSRGIIYGTPLSVDKFEITITAGRIWFTTATLTITVKDRPSSGPVIESSSSVTAKTGASFTFDVIASGNPTTSITTTALPPGLTIDPTTGVISGIPTSDTNSLVTLSASDGGEPHTSTLQFNFVSDSGVPIVNSPNSAFLTPNRFFTRTLTATVSNASIQYVGLNGVLSNKGGTLPQGLQYNEATHTISGIYTGPATPNPASIVAIDTIKIRPPLIGFIQTIASHSIAIDRTDGTEQFGTGTNPLNFFVVNPPDFNEDGRPDFVLFNPTTSASEMRYLNDNAQIGSAQGPTLPAGWNLVDAADFNEDGKADYILFNPGTRQTVIWYVSEARYVKGVYGPTITPGYELLATADLNSDGRPDFVLYNPTTHRTAIWYLNGNAYIGAAFGPMLVSGYMLVGLADFNSDARPDYLLFDPTTRRSAIWYLHGNTLASSAYGPIIASGYKLIGTADFNRDTKPDLVLYNTTTRQTAIWYLNNNSYTGGKYGPTLSPGYSLAAP